jgi:hypothetical protein
MTSKKDAPVLKAFKIENITPVVRADAKRLRITYGPYLIKAANVSTHMDKQMW